MKREIDDIYLWFDLDDEYTKKLIKETTTNNKTSKELVMLVFDMYDKEFGIGT